MVGMNLVIPAYNVFIHGAVTYMWRDARLEYFARMYAYRDLRVLLD